MFDTAFTFLDVETTGASLKFGKVIELAAIRVENGQIVEKINTLINPKRRIPKDIEQFNGITQDMVNSAPTFEDIAPDLLSLLEDSTLVAHNAAFDYGFLKKEFRDLGGVFTHKYVCSVKVSRAFYPEFKSHSLDSIINRFGFVCENRHRAYDDTIIIHELFKKISEQFDSQHVQDKFSLLLKKTSLPNNLERQKFDNLPENSGVYIFYGHNDTPLYVGKSKNIRDRVQSHFYNATNETKSLRIADQMNEIKTIRTAGELGALIRESQLVKDLLPIYNTRLRKKQNLIYIEKIYDVNGYINLDIKEASNIDVGVLPNMMGVFKTKGEAKKHLQFLSEKHLLCEKLLGLEKGAGPCFRQKLGVCPGACVQKESADLYNLRVENAFIFSKITPWPFDGPVLIKEQNPYDAMVEYHLIDKWCYISSVSGELNELDNISFKLKYNFDYDLYLILNAYIRDIRNQKNIKPISYSDLEQYSI